MNKDKIEFLFQELDSEDSVNRLAKSLGTTAVMHTIKIPEELGKGLIRKFSMEEGLSMRVWNFELNKPFVLDKRPDPTSAAAIFQIAYILNPEAIMVKNDKGKDGHKLDGLNIMFVSDNAAIRTELMPDKKLEAMDISFTPTWLMNTFADADESLRQFIQNILDNPAPSILYESTSAAEYRMMADVYASASGDVKYYLQVKAGVLSLLSIFFRKIYERSLNTVQENKNFYQGKMLEVEKILHAHLQKKLPGIEQIARDVALGQSTLKRHFKQMFGKSIYEYYLELKMDLAKRVLLEQQLSVTQVAGMLNYEKVSNFIDMFKRHHGVSPGTLRHRKFTK